MLNEKPDRRARRIDQEMEIVRAMREAHRLEIDKLEEQIACLKEHGETVQQAHFLTYGFFFDRHRELAKEFVIYCRGADESAEAIAEAIEGIEDLS